MNKRTKRERERLDGVKAWVRGGMGEAVLASQDVVRPLLEKITLAACDESVSDAEFGELVKAWLAKNDEVALMGDARPVAALMEVGMLEASAVALAVNNE